MGEILIFFCSVFVLVAMEFASTNPKNLKALTLGAGGGSIETVVAGDCFTVTLANPKRGLQCLYGER